MTVTELPAANSQVVRRLGNEFRGAPDRWMPTRAGLIGVWQYADETFEFERGRLVLFGPNGSGKTMALELLYPYLLDANAAPYRLSTAGGTERGGLWSRVSGYDERAAGRIGYLWAEFTRTLSDGTRETFTCGTRLEPRGGNRGGKHTWFTTSLRIGHDLSLLDNDRIPLTPSALKSAIGSMGHVSGDDTVGYRNTVRSTLYSDFTEDQYASMIEGLLAVRKQSITEGLNPEKLHLLLSDGLPPLDPRELDQVARGFEGLDAQREAITELEAAVVAADALSDRVRRHAAAVLNLAAKDVTTATSKLDGLTRSRRSAEQRRDGATVDEVAASSALNNAADEVGELDERRRQIYASPGYSHIGELDRVTQSVADQRQRAQEAATDATRLAGLAASARSKAEQTSLDAGQVRSELAAKYRELCALSLGARIEVPAALLPAEAAAFVDVEARVRRLAIDEVRTQLDAVTGAERDVEREREAVGRAEELERELRDELDQAGAEVDETVAAWAGEVRSWAGRLVELTIDSDRLNSALDAADLTEVVAAATSAAADALTRLGRLDETLQHQRDELDSRRTTAAEERDQLSRNDMPTSPKPAPWRAERPAGRHGAALWQLLAPSDATQAATLDAIESALDGAGILDAWVDPDGRVDLGDLGARIDLSSAGSSTLARYLHVDTDAAEAAGVESAAVGAVLDAVTVADTTRDGDEGVRIGLDASFTYGPVHGRPVVRSARYLGSVARERARVERLAELDELIAELDGALGELDHSRALLAERSTVARTEAEAVPAGAAVTAAREHITRVGAQLSAAEGAIADSRYRLGVAQTALGDAHTRRDQVAHRHGLPTTSIGLNTIANHLNAAERAALQLPETITRSDAADRIASETKARAATSEADAERLAAHAVAEERKADRDAAGLAELRANVGADAEQTRTRLEAINERLERLAKDLKSLQGLLTTAHDAVTRAATELEALEFQVEEALAARDSAEGQFRVLVDAGVAADAGFERDWDLSNTTGVRAATREVNSARGPKEPTYAIAQRAKTNLDETRYQHTETLTGRVEMNLVELEVGELPAIRATATIGGVTMTFTALAGRLRDDLGRARSELADAETELFEKTLTGSLRAHLASRLRAAQGLVDGMNDLLSGIRSASGGVAVSLRWDVADDLEDRATLRTIKGLLLRDHHSAEEREILYSFLSRRVDQVRATDRAVTSWRDALERLFDYRLWHRFAILVRHDRYGDTPVAFTSRKVSLSTGEKALVLSLPLFAAVASHYMPRDVGADLRRCPRFLLLDEVFPKNDPANKRQILSLLTELGLDAVMTSDKDRCDYDTVDGVAITILHKAGDDTYSTRLVWNGYETIARAADTGTVPRPAAVQSELEL